MKGGCKPKQDPPHFPSAFGTVDRCTQTEGEAGVAPSVKILPRCQASPVLRRLPASPESRKQRSRKEYYVGVGKTDARFTRVYDDWNLVRALLDNKLLKYQEGAQSLEAATVRLAELAKTSVDRCLDDELDKLTI